MKLSRINSPYQPDPFLETSLMYAFSFAGGDTLIEEQSPYSLVANARPKKWDYHLKNVQSGRDLYVEVKSSDNKKLTDFISLEVLHGMTKDTKKYFIFICHNRKKETIEWGRSWKNEQQDPITAKSSEWIKKIIRDIREAVGSD